MKFRFFHVVGAAIVTLALIATVQFLKAQESSVSGTCPAGIKTCKIIALTPEEEQTLIGPGAIFEAAVFANKMQLEALVKAWRDKIAQSPAGKVAEPAKPDAPNK